MVKVLADGELVQDNDPRVQPPPISQVLLARTGNAQSLVPRNSISTHQNGWRIRGISYIHTVNQWFNNRGIPTIHVGQFSVEPIISTGLLASLILFGDRGFFISGLLVLAGKYFQFLYQRRNPGPSRGDITRPVQQNSLLFSGPGHRLGTS